MRIVVGGSGLIGDKPMTALHDAGHHAVAASPAFGIDAYTGEGLDEAMARADVVVDVSNAPSWGDQKVLEFFTTVTRNALKAGRRAGARHRVALSVLGCDRSPESATGGGCAGAPPLRGCGPAARSTRGDAPRPSSGRGAPSQAPPDPGGHTRGHNCQRALAE